VLGANHSVFPVLGADDSVKGVLTLDGLRSFIYDEELGQLAIAADCTQPLVSVQAGDTLAAALERFTASQYPELLVMGGDAGREVVGAISYSELMRAYNKELAARRLAESGSPPTKPADGEVGS